MQHMGPRGDILVVPESLRVLNKWMEAWRDVRTEGGMKGDGDRWRGDVGTAG